MIKVKDRNRNRTLSVLLKYLNRKVCENESLKFSEWKGLG